MNTTETPTLEQQQDSFTLQFMAWLERSYRHLDTDIYVPRGENICGKEGDKRLTAAECLAEYRKIHIPPLPTLQTNLEHQITALADSGLKKAYILFEGMERLASLSHKDGLIQKEAIEAIILDTMDQLKQIP